MASDRLLMKLTTEIVAALGSNNRVPVEDLGDLEATVHRGLSEITEARPRPIEQSKSIQASVGRKHLVCLKCDRKLKLLKRHLKAVHGLTPDQYRLELGLPRNYPMLPAEFLRERREFAKSIGLGRTRSGG